MSTVKFCNQCDSLYFIQHDTETKTLNYICKNCGNSEECDKYLIYELDSTVNHKLHYIEELLRINPRIMYDPSIPKIQEKCKQCEGKEIALIKYDDEALSYVYMCCNEKCRFYWINKN